MPPPRQSTSASSLPSGFVTVKDILEDRVRERSKINVVGIVTDFRVPVPTKGADWKCQIRLYDQSIEDEQESLLLNVFRPQTEMPTAGPGDVMLLISVTVQRYRLDPLSLLTNRQTKIHVYEASKIPRPPSNASRALRSSPKSQAPPGEKENAYVPYLLHYADKSRIPDASEFEVLKIKSGNVKDKFSELKDVREGRFYDIIAQVVKSPFDLGDKMTLWVSDYTANPAFFNHQFGGKDLSGGRDGDPFGYTNKFAGVTSPADVVEWTGPFGTRSIQITVFEPHTDVIRGRNISLNTWVSIKNLHIKLGHNNSNLEGYLRQDREAPEKLGIMPLSPIENPESINPQLKEAIRRKRDYERQKKEQVKDIEEAAKAGQKRKANMVPDSEPKDNTDSRRRKKRAKEQAAKNKKKLTQAETQVPAVADLNLQVKCENENKPASPIAELLQPVFHDTTIDGQTIKLQLPFVNTNYRAHVRVVDFLPSKLEDFAISRKSNSEFDVLSDNDESDSDSDSSERQLDSSAESTAPSSAPRKWEWRFYLQLEDAAVTPNQKKERVWVAVDNQAAQCLTWLDATNLRRDPNNLEALRQRLFILWGELEEHKSREKADREEALRASKHNKPPQHSDDEDGPIKTTLKESVSNRPFSCCLRQYGVKVRDTDDAKADAGEGKRWERMFGLFGTSISRTA
ncbi:Fc.00g052600.m01.CDS01 [Cosmosporella sp. VM-42]